MVKRKKFTKEEIEFIVENYKNLGVKIIAEILNRKINVIFRKAKELSLTDKKELYYYTKEEISEAVAKAKNLSEVLKNLKLFSKGGNYKTVKKYIEFYNIDTEHFKKRDFTYLKFLNKKPIETILVENSTYTHTSTLKNRLYKEGLKLRQCEECGQGEYWRGKKMSLILDHVNGINNDNRFENLRIVCPNCNATLDTHCGKNKAKEKREVRKKEREINAHESRINRRKVKDRPSIETLKKEIEEMGYSATGRKYGVSDNAIRKWLK